MGGSGFDFALARYNPNGSLDTSFSGDGKQTTDFGGSEAASGVALQSDGKIVAVGGERLRDFALARYNPNGSLDTTFSGDGKQTTDFGGSDGARGVALQADGKIVAVGIAGGNGSSFALARYNPNGTLDPTFSGDGKQTTSFGGYFDGATAVALQGDGKIVAVGHAGAANGDFALTRYNPNGSLDTTFSGDGKQTTDFGGDDGRARWRSRPTARSSRSGVRRAGAASPSPATTPTAPSTRPSPATASRPPTSGASARERARWRSKQTARSSSVSSACSFGVCGDFALARYNPNGSLDTSFSGDGKQTTNLGDAAEGATGVAIQGDGKIIAVGSGGPDFGDFALARYNPNGSLDTSFSGDGKQTTDFGGSDGANAVALQGGKIVLVGSGSLGGTGGNDFALARYNTERLARHELLRRRQADNGFRHRRCGECGGAPGRRQDRRGWPRRGRWRLRLLARALQRQRRA